MTRPVEKRDARRVILPTHADLTFQVGGHQIEGAIMSNLSHGGCLAMVPTRGGAPDFFVTGAVIPDLIIHHPNIEASPIVARVAWSMGAQEDVRAVGLQFMEMDSATRISIVATVDGAILEPRKPD